MLFRSPRPVPLRGDAGLREVVERAIEQRDEAPPRPIVCVVEGPAKLLHLDGGTAERHGILREIPTTYRYDDRYDRQMPVDQITVEASGGASNKVALEQSGGTTTIRVGDANRTVTGAHTYRLTYRVRGALNAFPDHDELYWNAIGTGWAVPIALGTADVHVPLGAGQSLQIACYEGPEGSHLTCRSAAAEGGNAHFETRALRANSALTVVVGFPKGVLPEPAPILRERWSVQRAFTIDPLRVGLADRKSTRLNSSH